MAEQPTKLSPDIHVFGTTKGGGTGKKPKVSKTSDSKYAAPGRVKGDDAKKLSEVREKIAKNADKATTASGEIGQKDLPNIIQMVDPQGTAQVIPQMYQQIGMMTSLLSLGSGSSGGGASSSNPSFSTMPSGISAVINDSFTGALVILTRKYGFEEVIRVFNDALYSDAAVQNIDVLYRDIVLNSLANLIRLALYFGPLNIPVSQYDDVVFGDIVPDPVVSTTSIPDLYLKVYYTLDNDPYPGYQEWVSQDGTNTKIYTKKEPKTYHFNTINEEIYSTSETEIAADLDLYFQYVFGVEERIYLTATILNDILYRQMLNVETNTLNNGVGNNAANSPGGKNGGGGNMAGKLGGGLNQLMNMFQTGQLPTSVLNQGNMSNVMQQFTKDMGLNNQIFGIGKQIMGGGGFLGGSPLGMLGNMGGLGNIMGGFGLGGGGLGGVLGGIGLGPLMGGFGSFGGNSGGGGGGAGSGFGGASGGGDYTGGELSEEALIGIQELLNRLGIVE
jgi:hypothetical protein